MAKKRKKSSGRRPRRRVSGVGAMGGSFGPILAAIGGYAAAGMVEKVLPSSMSDTIKGAALIGVGALLMPKVIKGPIGTGLGIGMGVKGGASLLKSTGLIGNVADFYRVPTINGPRGMRSVSGGAAQLLAGVAAETRAFGSHSNMATGTSQMNMIAGVL